ncbi:hypothetical protein PsorP6_000459 [Peronosclerospora sorghi]|uniref:Uncharacterized protein n=1 Tax=Peronosclerospora sorghi TaxID=230839 RepID=A0ACC0WTE3_9STRA|nr:hypothetical protein PsorP6_000459 [Peronosclerospora sorghi]
MICLKRFHGASSRYAAYECLIREVTGNLPVAIQIADKLKEKESVTLEAHFHPQIADYLKLSVGKLVRIFEPIHSVPEHVAVGSVSKPKWFLVHTKLTQTSLDVPLSHFTPTTPPPSYTAHAQPKMDDSMVPQLRADVKHHLKRTLRMTYHDTRVRLSRMD